ncbi:uncharacterized protein LOC116308415 [Actinia tenebrosa]|uniref:Uncharacterized protein LOC116308415 n=1 Tax=Actinia tenebrosa TaxID=6105 RepID=A0A6P8J4S8_ACTTE|nr:uncharacterized protein LOC116308415 [Actinia tenebrosa]
MIKRTQAEVVFLDHNYCAPVSLTQEIATIKSSFIMADNGETLSWEKEMGIEFDPPNLQSALPCSALSPSHSIDSGFDNEMSLLTDFNLEDYLTGFGEGKVDFGPQLGALFPEEDISENAIDKPSKTQQTQKTATRNSVAKIPSASTSTETKRWKVSARQKAMMEGPIDEEEKNKKNAIAARENRLKKKKYIESIEIENGELKQENAVLKAKDIKQSKAVEKLENEVAYLKNVIANQSTLSALLKSVVSTPGISFTSSFAPQELMHTSAPAIDVDDDKTDDDDDDTRRYKTRGSRKRNLDAATPCSPKKRCRDVKGGVCLHVNQDKVSLEFCEECSIKAHEIGHK